jgi:hypothetical protein
MNDRSMKFSLKLAELTFFRFYICPVMRTQKKSVKYTFFWTGVNLFVITVIFHFLMNAKGRKYSFVT